MRDGKFLRVGQLARHVIGRLRENKTEELTAVFGVIEWVLAEGDSEARSLLAIRATNTRYQIVPIEGTLLRRT